MLEITFQFLLAGFGNTLNVVSLNVGFDKVDTNVNEYAPVILLSETSYIAASVTDILLQSCVPVPEGKVLDPQFTPHELFSLNLHNEAFRVMSSKV